MVRVSQRQGRWVGMLEGQIGMTRARGLNGRAIYVAGGEGWDIEEGLDNGAFVIRPRAGRCFGQGAANPRHWRKLAQQRMKE
jgi:hypothetical protein